MKAGSPDLRIAWHMAKKGKINVNTIWPDNAPITNIGISHYDDDQARFGMETAATAAPGACAPGWPLPRARARNSRFRSGASAGAGDNPTYIQNMYEFFRDAGDGLAHEGYLNGNGHELYSRTAFPKSSAIYRTLF